MPSKDRTPPEQNAWIPGWEKPDVIGSPGPGLGGSTTERRGRTPIAAVLLRRAERSGKTVEDYVAGIPEDTLKRLRAPVIEQPQPDGTIKFKHDHGISEGPIASHR